MKKRSLISMLVVMAMLVTTFASMFAIGVNAAASQPYTYASDTAALDDGAIAKFSNGGYAKTLDDVFALGGTYGNVTMLVPELSVTADPKINFGTRNFTVSGGENGFTLKTSATISITGTTGTLTLDKFNVVLSSSSAQNWVARLENGGTKVILKNSKFEAKSVVNCAVIVLQNNVNLTLDSGAQVLSGNYAGGSKASCTNSGILFNGTANQSFLTINAGARVEVAGNCITTGWSTVKAPKITINGGYFKTTGTSEGTNAALIYTDNEACELTIHDGEFYSTGRMFRQTASTAKITLVINDGYFETTGQYLILPAGTSSSVTINGGTFKAPNGQTVSMAGASSTLKITNGNFTSNSYTVYFNGSATGSTLTIENGTFTSVGTPTNDGDSKGIVVNTDSKITANIKGGSFYTENGRNVVRAKVGSTFNISGGTFEGKNLEAVVGVNASTLNITGGTFDANGADVVVTRFNSKLDGVTFDSSMKEGASVRTAEDTSGIRFQSTISKSLINSIIDYSIDGKYSVGTIIVRYDDLLVFNQKENKWERLYDINKAALELANITYLDIPAVDGIHDKGDYYLVNAAMTNINPNLYGTDFVAVTYIKYETANGTVTMCASYDADKNVRNIQEIAYSALADVAMVGDTVKNAEGEEVELTAENAYELGYNLVTTWYEYDKETGAATVKTGTAYTEYSAAQREVIAQYIAKANA